MQLPFQAQVAHDFSDLLELEPFNNAPANADGYEQRDQRCSGSSEGDELEETDTWDVRGLVEVVEEVVQHRLAFSGS